MTVQLAASQVLFSVRVAAVIIECVNHAVLTENIVLAELYRDKEPMQQRTLM